jgi:hypothetical protein
MITQRRAVQIGGNPLGAHLSGQELMRVAGARATELPIGEYLVGRPPRRRGEILQLLADELRCETERLCLIDARVAEIPTFSSR